VSADATVYVIDDDTSVRRALARLLNVAGYRVLTFESATAFLSLTVLERPLCLVVDVRMPGLTGFDLQDALKVEGRDCPIVFVTGHADAGMAARATAAGALALLAKPVDDDALLEHVRMGLDRDRQHLDAETKSRNGIRSD
jgi:FixJ family two-component response regulator